MWQNHFKLAWRHLLKNRVFSAIQLTGLTSGISACLLIGLYLHHEWSYDACHEKGERIVKVNMEYSFGGEVVRANVTGNKVAPALANDFPEVESAVRVIDFPQVVKFGDVLAEEKGFFFADSTFFDIFTFPLLKGDPKTALNAPYQVVLTQSTARRYFGEADPMGKTLKVGVRWEVTVTGVMADPPANTHIKPDIVCSFVSLPAARPENETWWNANYATYLLLKHHEGQASMQARLTKYMASKANETGSTGNSYLTFHLQKLRDLHLKSNVPGNFEPNGDIRYMYILGTAALLILLIGCTIYINLATAAGMERAKETGVHKVLGAERSQLAARHLGEAAIITFSALIIAFLTTAPLLPVFNRIFNRELTAEPLFHPAAWVVLAGFGVLISFMAGFYPAIVVSRFMPVMVLKGNFKFENSGIWLRKILVVVQFSISILLIICTLLLKEQLRFIQNKKLGFDKEQVLVLPADGEVVKNYGAIKSQLLQQSAIQSVTLSYDSPAHIKGGYNIGKNSSEQENRPVTALPVGLDFLRTMNLELVNGSDFNAADIEAYTRLYDDSTVVLPVLLNEAQVNAFGWAPEEALHKRLYFNGGQAMVKGVVNDFHFRSLHEEVAPLVIFPSDYGRFVIVKLAGGSVESGIQHAGAVWQALAPHRPFSFHFLDDELTRMYEAEQQTARMVAAFSWLAILMACLGLFGLATYSIAQRTKEIGIRKVLGATVASIVAMLTSDFLKLVFVAFAVASPIAWYLTNQWLQDFAYRIDIPLWVFGLSGVAALAVAGLTLSIQSVRAALNNPVESLRSE